MTALIAGPGWLLAIANILALSKRSISAATSGSVPEVAFARSVAAVMMDSTRRATACSRACVSSR
jgi:hypothetical protein